MRRALLPLLALTTLLAAAPPARAAGYQELIRECAKTQQVTNPLAWSRTQYEQAINHLPADVAEYTDCGSILQRAELAATAARARAASGGSTSGGPGGGTSAGAVGPVGSSFGGGPRNAAENSALQQAVSVPPVASAGTSSINPLLRSGLASAGHPLPGPLSALLVVLAAAMLLATGPFLLRRVRARRQR